MSRTDRITIKPFDTGGPRSRRETPRTEGLGEWGNPETMDYRKGLKESLLIVKTEAGQGILLGWCDNVTMELVSFVYRTVKKWVYRSQSPLKKDGSVLRSYKFLFGYRRHGEVPAMYCSRP
jgi:hypothetical protein